MSVDLSSLFSSNDLVLNSLFVVRPAAGGAQSVHVVLDIIETKLANLEGR